MEKTNPGKRKPNFVRQDSHKKKKLRKNSWRKPKGLQSKIRLGFKGYNTLVKNGYRTKKSERYSHKSGLRQKYVSSLEELKKADPKKDGIIIKASLGLKKKLSLMKEAGKMGLKILNFADPEGFVKAKEEQLKKEKETKSKQQEKKEAKEKAAKKAAEKKSLEKSVKTDEEKKEQEKKEYDKLLTKKGTK